MKKWAERIWWKAIQDNEIRIFFDIDGKKEEIKVLEEWVSKPGKMKNYSTHQAMRLEHMYLKIYF